MTTPSWRSVFSSEPEPLTLMSCVPVRGRGGGDIRSYAGGRVDHLRVVSRAGGSSVTVCPRDRPPTVAFSVCTVTAVDSTVTLCVVTPITRLRL